MGDNGGPWWAALCDDLVRQVVALWGLPEPEGLAWREVRLSPEAVVALAGGMERPKVVSLGLGSVFREPDQSHQKSQRWALVIRSAYAANV